MTSLSAPAPSGAPHLVPVEDLQFDRRSPRLQEEPAAASQDQLLERLWRDFALEGLAASIARSGFFAHEPLIVEPGATGLVVVDGNRRLAAVRVLTDAPLRERLDARDLPAAPAARLEQLRQLPVLVAPRSTVWPLLGYRHVGGAQPWRSHGRAVYVAWVHEELGVPLDEVAQGLGDSGGAVRALYRALTVLRQAGDAGVFQVDDRWTSHFPFSLLVEALDAPAIRGFIGLDGGGADEERVPPDRMRELGELCAWLFGSRSREMAPAVQTHGPDLRLLEQVVGSPGALARLRQGQPLRAAFEAGQVDRRDFHESVRAARRHLQQAYDSLPPGAGGAELLRSVDDLVGLARRIRDEIHEEGPGA